MDKTRFGQCVLHVAHDTFLLSGYIGVSLMHEKHTIFSGFYVTLFKIYDHPQKMDICGSTFHYERKYKNSKAKGPLTLFAPESIRALGPTTCSLYVVVSCLCNNYKES